MMQIGSLKSSSLSWREVNFLEIIEKCFFHEACSFIKKEALAKVFSGEFCENFKNIFLQNTPERLILFFEKFRKYSQHLNHFDTRKFEM